MSDDVAGFAMHALEPDEETAVRSHLPQCATCRGSLREIERVLDGLATSAEQAEPPARLRSDILARAAAMSRSLPAPRATPRRRSATASRGSATGRRPGTDPPTRHAPGSGDQQVGPGARRRLAAAALAVVAALTIGGLATYTAQLQQQRDTRIAQSRTLADLLTEFGTPGTTHATLRTSEGQPVAAVLTTAAAQTVVIAGLAPNDGADTAYVIWGISTTRPRPIATFDVDAAGPSVHRIDPAAGPQRLLGYAISLEPGHSAPTTPTIVVASGQITAGSSGTD